MEEQISFSSDGESVFAVLHIPESTPAPGLIMCHGFTGHKAEAHRLFVTAARDFADNGLAVLRFDFRGSGDSSGDFSQMTVSREIADAGAALDFLAARPEADPNRLGILGLSLGGCVAACLAGRDERAQALVLWAPAARTGRIHDRLLSEFGASRMLDMNGWPLGRAFLDELPTIRPLEEVKSYLGPSLIVHGAADESVPVAEGSDYRVALGGRCQLHIVQGADHVFSSLPWQSEAISVSRDFLIEAFGAPR